MNEWEDEAVLQRTVFFPPTPAPSPITSEMASFQVPWQSWSGPVGSSLRPQGQGASQPHHMAILELSCPNLAKLPGAVGLESLADTS